MNLDNAHKLGRFLGMLLTMGNPDSIQRTRKFMRLRVLVDITKSLKSGCYITREDSTKHYIAFCYERLSDFCYRCDKITHTETACADPPLPPQPARSHDPRYSYGPLMRSQSPGISKTHKPSQQLAGTGTAIDPSALQIVAQPPTAGTIPHHPSLSLSLQPYNTLLGPLPFPPESPLKIFPISLPLYLTPHYHLNWAHYRLTTYPRQ